MRRSRAGAEVRARRRPGELSRQRAAPEAGRRRSVCSTAATANGARARRRRQEGVRARRSASDARAQTARRRPALPVRAAQARPPRLHGAEGGRDGRLAPCSRCITRHTQAERVNLERMRANAIEAAEQCGILDLPEIAEPVKLGRAGARLDGGPAAGVLRRGGRREGPGRGAGIGARRRHRGRAAGGVLIGPEGGFADRRARGAAEAAATSCGLRSARASCAPIPPRSRRWRWCRRCSATGADRREPKRAPSVFARTSRQRIGAKPARLRLTAAGIPRSLGSAGA